MSVKKKTKTILVCTCDLPECGKSWESQGETIPTQCRWCCKRTWNRPDLRPILYITAKGKTQSIAAWVKETGISRSLLRYRIIKGWSHEDAVAVAPGAQRPGKEKPQCLDE